jgi:hypothetical protein
MSTPAAKASEPEAQVVDAEPPGARLAESNAGHGRSCPRPPARLPVEVDMRPVEIQKLVQAATGADEGHPERSLTVRPNHLEQAIKLVLVGRHGTPSSWPPSMNSSIRCSTACSIFQDEDRPPFVDNLKAVIPAGGRYFMLCFSDLQPGRRRRPRLAGDHHPAVSRRPGGFNRLRAGPQLPGATPVDQPQQRLYFMPDRHGQCRRQGRAGLTEVP